MKTKYFFQLAVLLVFSFGNFALNAHCDMIEGPVIKDAIKAIENNNVNYVLKWVDPDGEKEVKDAFDLSMKARNSSPEAKIISDKYFFETLVRIHLQGEGKPFEGVKPIGTPIDDRIIAADKSIDESDFTHLENMVPKQKINELKKMFANVKKLKNYDVNDLKAGRKYVDAYVKFFHFAESSGEAHKCIHE